MKHIFVFLAVLILFILGSKQVKSDELTTKELTAEVIWQVTQAIDMFQTIEIGEHGERWYETNPILGRDPNTPEIVGYFAIRGYAHYWITKNIRKEFRWPWLAVTTYLNYDVIEHNHSMGIRIQF
jgi:hypothetical protein